MPDDVVFVGPHREQRVVIPVNGINRAVVQAVNFGRTLSPDLRAVFVTTDPEAAVALRRRWVRQFPGRHAGHRRVPVPHRDRAGRRLPRRARLAWPADQQAPITIVVLPEYVARHWWERILYNQQARRLKSVLVGREHTVIADVPYRREH